jgi:hypothetical protein
MHRMMMGGEKRNQGENCESMLMMMMMIMGGKEDIKRIFFSSCRASKQAAGM